MQDALCIQQGQMLAFFAFDVGYEVTLDKISQFYSALPIQPISRKKQTPHYLQYSKPPQILYLGETDFVFHQLRGQVYATVFDFGAISISYRWSFTNANPALPMEGLPQLSQALYEEDLESHARRQLNQLVQKIRPAIIRPELSELVEDYYVFVLEALSKPLNAHELLNGHKTTLAQTLRFDTEPLSLEQQEETLSKPISYYEKDLTLIDWNTAIIYDADYTDTVSVLELLNVELLEARYMDAQLDKRIGEYEGLTQQHRQWVLPFYNPHRQVIQELAELRIEAALLSERVDNALKLIGDLYLARIHKAASERFYMHEWDTSISRKLEIIGNFYQLLTDRLNTTQAQTLELVIIILILIEILLGIFAR